MTHFLSDKIKVMSFFAIILVLYIHSGFHDYPNEIHGMTFNFMLQDFISGMIGRCAVPLFYAISGYLFFANVDLANGSVSPIFAKMKKRVHSLVVPFLITAWFPALFYLTLEYVPEIGAFVNVKGFSQNLAKPLPELLCLIYWDSGGGAPYAFHLWFLRDLIIIVAFTPLIFQILRCRFGGTILLCSLFFLNFISVPVIPVYGMFWFVFGHCFLTKLNIIKGWLPIWLAVIFIFICFLQLFYPDELWDYFKIPIIALGIISMWTLYDRIVPASFILTNQKWLMVACNYTFFIYLFHEPTLNIIRKLIVIPFQHSSFGFALSYILSPWIFAILWISFGLVVKKMMPKIYGICVGGR